MGNSPLQNLIQVCKILNDNEVKYLVVGGTAVGVHGKFRPSLGSDGQPMGKPDIDIWFRPGYENLKNLIGALEEMGFEKDKLKLGEPKRSYFSHEFEFYKLDFLPEITGINEFSEAYNQKYTVKLYGTEVYVISKQDLIKTKEIQGRPKDIEDLKYLKSNPIIKDQGLSR